jgi:hypothetical protein
LQRLADVALRLADNAPINVPTSSVSVGRPVSLPSAFANADYAANAVVYWPVEAIRSQFERTTERQGLDPSITLQNFLGENRWHEDRWTSAGAGRD